MTEKSDKAQDAILDLPAAAEPFQFFRRTPHEAVEAATTKALQAQEAKQKGGTTKRRKMLEVNIGRMVRTGGKTQRNMMQLLRFRIIESGVDEQGVSLADERLVNLLAMYDAAKQAGRSFDTDQACFTCGIHPAECYGWYAEEAMRHSRNVALAAVAAASPEIIRASIANALTPEGIQDRRMHMEAIGFVRPRGSTTVKVENNNTNDNKNANIVPPPDPAYQVGFEVEARRVGRKVFPSMDRPKVVPALKEAEVPCTTAPSSKND